MIVLSLTLGLKETQVRKYFQRFFYYINPSQSRNVIHKIIKILVPNLGHNNDGPQTLK